jgi:hypothetical protein
VAFSQFAVAGRVLGLIQLLGRNRFIVLRCPRIVLLKGFCSTGGEQPPAYNVLALRLSVIRLSESGK